MRNAIITLSLLAAALLVACGSTTDGGKPTATPVPTEIVDPNTISDPQDALDAARALWAANGGDDYDMTFNWQCFCIPDYVQQVDLQVRAGSVQAGSVTDTGDPLTADQLAEYQPVGQLFDILQDAILKDAAEIRVTYAATGYPAEVWIDFNLRTADEELGFFIHEMAVS